MAKRTLIVRKAKRTFVRYDERWIEVKDDSRLFWRGHRGSELASSPPKPVLPPLSQDREEVRAHAHEVAEAFLSDMQYTFTDADMAVNFPDELEQLLYTVLAAAWLVD